MNGEIPIFNVGEEQESLFLHQVGELVGGKNLLFAASVSYIDIEDSVFECVFVSAHDDLGSISYHVALLQRSYLNMKQIQVGEKVWEIPADTWSVCWTAEDGIVFSSDDVRICTIRCEDEEILYELIVQCEDIAYEQLFGEPTPEDPSELVEPIAAVEVSEEVAEPELLTIEEWLNQQYSVMSVDQIFANIDEWSVEMLRETYQYELSGRSRPKVLSTIIEYLGFVGEDPRILADAAIHAPEPVHPIQDEISNVGQVDPNQVSLEWDAYEIEGIAKVLYKWERTSDEGRTWVHLGTTAATSFVDKKRTLDTTDIYKLSVVDTSGTCHDFAFYSPIKAELSEDDLIKYIAPFLGEIPEEIRKKNAKVMKNDKGTLQVHCPFCGSFTEKTLHSTKRFNQAIENTNRANAYRQKAQKRQRQAEKFIAMGDRLSLSANGAMRANQIETNHMIQDQLRGDPSPNLTPIKNDAEVECKNCGELVDEI
jgi:hypothetical protein